MWWLELIIESANGCSQFCELGMCAGLSWAILLWSLSSSFNQQFNGAGSSEKLYWVAIQDGSLVWPSDGSLAGAVNKNAWTGPP